MCLQATQPSLVIKRQAKQRLCFIKKGRYLMKKPEVNLCLLAT